MNRLSTKTDTECGDEVQSPHQCTGATRRDKDSQGDGPLQDPLVLMLTQLTVKKRKNKISKGQKVEAFFNPQAAGTGSP